jgi:hypothetical protein
MVAPSLRWWWGGGSVHVPDGAPRHVHYGRSGGVRVNEGGG